MKNISIENIYWMLAYAFRVINEKTIEKMTNEKFDNIYDLFAVMMTNELNKQIKRGLNREYIETKDELSAIRGKLSLNDLMERELRKTSKVVCVFDDYSNNYYLNQIVKTACYYLIRSKKIKNKNRVIDLKKSLIYFDGIDCLNPNTIKWDFIKYNRYNMSYKFLINISYLIIEGLLMSEKTGIYDYRDYIDDQKMHKLYEKFILEYYKYHYSNLFPSSPQIEWDVENNDSISLLPKMQTDIALYKDDRMLIIDAKYYNDMYQRNSLYDKETFKSNNIYQIYTYVKNKDKDNTGKVSGMLLYVKTDSNEKQYFETKVGNNNIIICNLDLSVNFEYVRKQLNSIVEKFSLNLL